MESHGDISGGQEVSSVGRLVKESTDPIQYSNTLKGGEYVLRVEVPDLVKFLSQEDENGRQIIVEVGLQMCACHLEHTVPCF